VPLYALLLFGGKVKVDLEAGGLTVAIGSLDDGWVRMKAWPRIGVLAEQLK
jgi:ATP-dependent RNA helicase DHX57